MRRVSRMHVTCLLCASVASADVYEFTEEESTFWSDPRNWEVNNAPATEIPGAEDRAVILSGKTAVIEDGETFTVDTIWVQSAAELRIEETGVLILQNDDKNCQGGGPNPSCATGPDHSTIDGLLFLYGDGQPGGDAGTLKFTTEDHIIGEQASYSGEILSFETGNIIVDNVDVTNQLDTVGEAIIGSLVISTEQDGLFINEGVVQASSNFGTPNDKLTLDGAVADSEGAKWLVECDATLVFKEEASSLYGDFEDTTSGGTFEFHADVWTCGTFKRTGCACITLFNTGTTFRYKVYIGDPNECSEPVGDEIALWSPCSGAPDEDGYEVDESVTGTCGCEDP